MNQPARSRILTVCVISTFLVSACYRVIDENYGAQTVLIDPSIRFVLVRLPEDHGNIGQTLYDEMTLRGANVQFSDESANLGDFDVLIRYEASWRWDITWYLLALSVNVYEAQTDALIAASARYRTSLVRSSSETAARVLLDDLFGEREPGRDDE